ncbi:MAG TPA: Ig-like domain-containing protein, partial [Methanomicrobiales archaeon]|nr:Ig-like domain-containing protein [Methanomicrobiales archaeon]
GKVTFKDGSTVLGTGTLANGVATFATSSLSVASHSITAAYGGDGNFAASTSTVLTQTVKKK